VATTECTECDPDEGDPCDCDISEERTYSCPSQSTSAYQKKTYNWKVNYESFSLSESTIWGPVNDKPGMFSVDVVNTNYGYHSDISDLENNKQGSNDPSVSANKYELIEGNTYFEAHRTNSHVADADGPDGTGDGTTAFKQGTGVTGTDENMFTSETWNGNSADYTGQSDVPLNSCPGDSIRCIASLDLKTKQTGWGDNPGDSYEIIID